MVEDHRPAVEVIVWEFYANLHQRRGDSFRTWLRGRAIEVTPTLISEITGAPRVRDPVYPYPVNHLPARADLVACFAEGCPHQMELEGEGSLQMSDFSNDVRCIYHILASKVLPVISHTMITIERARCLYAMPTETPIDYDSVVTTTMMSVRLLDKGFALPYGALITWIAEHAGVDMTRLREIQPQKGAMGVHFLNSSQAHLWEAEQEPRAQRPQRPASIGRAPAGVEEHLDHLEDTVRQTREDLQQALQALQRARANDRAVLDRLCEHLMGPLDVRDYGIHSSSFSKG
jgi:hypothetical protein